MKHGNSLHLVTFLTVAVALVAADDAFITMERKDSSLNELLADDYLLLASKNTSRPIQKQKQMEATTSAPNPRTEHPFHAEQRQLLQGEHLFPAQKDMSKWYENEKSERSKVIRWNDKNEPSKVTRWDDKNEHSIAAKLNENKKSKHSKVTQWYEALEEAEDAKWSKVDTKEEIRVTEFPINVLTTPLPVPVEEVQLFEEEDFLPTEDFELLSRDKRATLGSGDLDTEAVFTVTLDEFYAIATDSEATRSTEVAAQLTQLLLSYEVEVETVTVSNLLEGIDSRAKYNCTMTFTGATDRQGVAYALERIWRSATLVGNYEVYTSPTVCNSANVELNAVCLLCSAARPCTAAGVCQEFGTDASSQRAEFGLAEADIKLAHQDDVTSSQIDIPNGMPVFGQKYTTMFLGDNGGASFGSPYNPHFLESMQSSFFSYICIYCDDFDNRYLSGNVWYQPYAAGQPWATNMLDRLTSEVREYTEHRNFKATWANVITWYNIPEFTTYSNIGTQGNSFQMILVTDGAITFVLFYYIDIQASLSFRENGVHGYKFLGTPDDVHELLYSRRTVANGAAPFPKPKMTTQKGNTQIVGKWIFQIGQSAPDFGSLCINWYLQNLPYRDNYKSRAQLLQNSRCPCWRDVFMFSAPFLPMAAFSNQAFFCSELRAQFGSQDSYECCYDALGRFIDQYPEAGGYHRYSSFLAPYQHKLQDSDPKDWCCVESNLCHLYNDIRPVSTCWGQQPIIILVFNVGDPHFVTLDGKEFTYNGIGEHRLLELNDTEFSFKVQCRSSQALSNTGEKVRASIFSAFAGEQKSETLGTAMFHVEMNKERTKMVIYIDDVDVTLAFRADPNYRYELGYFTAFKRSESRIDFSFTKTGITMAVQLVSGTLSQAILLPESYKTKTKGLLGNYNGNPDDDFKSPDGTLFAADSTDQELFPYGNSWAIQNQESSCLHYAPGESINTFTDTTFVPLFEADITPEQQSAATVVCGAGNKQCIYDYVVTGNSDLALATTNKLQEAVNTNKILANRAPTITGTNQLNVEVGKPSEVKFMGSDADGHTLSYVTVDSPSSGWNFDAATGTGTFTPTNDNPVKIGVAAKDTENTQSSVMDVKIRMCKGCVNGVCNYDSPTSEPKSESDALFQIVTCTCNTGYTGADCSVDRDGCENNPCGLGSVCTDSTPAEEVAGVRPYKCSSCLPGFQQPQPDFKCENIDECATNNGDCPANSECKDSIGSYKCTCKTGYRMNSDNTVCNDIDECLEHLTDCAQTCTNSDGSFMCGCHGGFSLNADGKKCDVTIAGLPAECPSTCDLTTELCVDDGTGSAKCTCKPGYELKAGETTCSDIDECGLSLCAQKCDNTDGSFACSCYPGFLLAPDNLDCLACSFPNYGEGCSSTCECQGRASECNTVNGCMCLSPWSGPNCESDTNECEVDPKICGQNGICTDIIGSYVCTCELGYTRHGDECIDLNECESDTNSATCPSNSECTNTLGSYTCGCSIGYIKSGDTCTDIDECATGMAQCEHDCMNLPGSFNCYCKPGHTLNDDRTTCTKDPDKDQPCAGLTNIECDHYCEVVNSQPVCNCNRGYTLAADGITCQDTDECSLDSLNLCANKETCINTPGSYTCGCPVGKKLENDGRNCADCDGSTWGLNCATNCSCSHLGASKCDSVTGCVCIGGWTGTTCDVDIDECATESCPANSDCVNQPGKFECQCRTGYKKSADGSTCEQVNECADSATNICEHMCVDDPGSYHCTCRAGFILEGMGTCTDIDECATGSHDCQQGCRNTAGSFTCQCFEGFKFVDSTRKTCEAITPQTCTKSCDLTNGGCLNQATDTCFCNSGYTLNGDGFTCDDNNECTQVPALCSGSCSNAPAGSYTCSCDPGFSLAADQTSCAACVAGKWGTECAEDCACKSENTESCNPVDGVCTCRTGWSGDTCETDVLECATTGICGDNGVCTEQPGTYQCTCDPGYLRTDVCTPCTSGSWGNNCENTCICNFANTLSCNAVTGTCTCRPGWTGADCTTDVNECGSSVSPAVCTGPHEMCVNNDGSYSCGCVLGYQRSANNTVCEDLNECLVSSLNTCTYVCNNIDGAFTCSCPRGYLGSENNCQANFLSTIILITLDFVRDSIISAPSSPAYSKLQADIGLAVDAQISPVLGNVHLPSVVKDLSTGSVTAPTEILIDKAQTDNELGELAKALEKLAEVRSLDVDGSTTAVTNITYKSIPILRGHSVCDVYRILRDFSINEYCELDENGTPVAKRVSETEDQVPLIVGLTVGSLVFLILLTLFLIYCCCYRKAVSRAPSEDRDDAFRSAFAGTIPTKGTFGASRYLMYSPHTLSDAASQVSDDSSGRRPRGPKKLGAYDFSDLPKWNTGGYPDFHETRGSEGRNDMSSDFSWGNMFNRLGQFEVPRPNVTAAPNKFHDSLA